MKNEPKKKKKKKKKKFPKKKGFPIYDFMNKGARSDVPQSTFKDTGLPSLESSY